MRNNYFVIKNLRIAQISNLQRRPFTLLHLLLTCRVQNELLTHARYLILPALRNRA